LWEYLCDPKELTWSQAAVAFAAGMLNFKQPWSAESILQQRDALRSNPQRVPSLLQVADLTRGAPAYWAGIDERKDATLIVHMPSVALQKAQLDQSELTLRLFDD